MAYQVSDNVSSSAGLGTEWVRSSRDDMDVVCQWPRSWNVDTGSRRYTPCCTRRRQVRWAFDTTSTFYVTARPGRRPLRHPSLESWVFLPVRRRPLPMSPSPDIILPSAGSLSSSHHLITTHTLSLYLFSTPLDLLDSVVVLLEFPSNNKLRSWMAPGANLTELRSFWIVTCIT